MRNLRNVQGLSRNTAFLTMLPDGTPGTEKTISYARQLIQEGLKNPQVRELVLKVLNDAGVRGFDETGELHALYEFVRQNFSFRDDPIGYQYLQPVTGILRTRSGNCASLNLILIPVLLGQVGYPTRAVTIKSDASMPDEFSHVYVEVGLKDGRWIPLDVARPDAAFGLAPSAGAYWEKAIWPLTAGQFTGGVMNGMRPSAFRAVRARLRGLGDGVDWSGFLATVPGIESGAAQIVSAANLPGYQVLSQGPVAGMPGAPGVAAPGLSLSAGGSSTWLFVIGLVVLGGIAAVAFRR